MGLIVRFRAGGMQEMCWHLFTWGEAVTVVGPAELYTTISAASAVLATHHGRADQSGKAAGLSQDGHLDAHPSSVELKG